MELKEIQLKSSKWLQKYFEFSFPLFLFLLWLMIGLPGSVFVGEINKFVFCELRKMILVTLNHWWLNT